MKREMTYCIKGNSGECPKSKECERSGDDLFDPYKWYFSGCSNNEKGEIDLFYFIPKLR